MLSRALSRCAASAPVRAARTQGLGYLFKGHRDAYRKSELVIFLRATILEDGGVDPLDAELDRRFSGDRRPFPMPSFAP
jgi:hypothetical protein